MAARLSPSKGGKPDKLWRDALHRALKRVPKKFGQKAIEVVADQLVALAMRGDLGAIKEIGDRIDGRPAQAIVGDSEGEPVRFVIQWPVKSGLYPNTNADLSSSPSPSAPSDLPAASLTDEPAKQ